MALTPQMLQSPFDWHDATFASMLADLQGNILKGHGRDHTVNVFLRFDPNKRASVKQALRGIKVTSAIEQLRQAEAFKAAHIDGGTQTFLMISAAGYVALGIDGAKAPSDPQFQAGMKAQAAALSDPDPVGWEQHLRDHVHALLIVAHDSDTKVANAEAAITAGLANTGISVLGRDVGRALRRTPKGAGIEHFGYVDGRSQPLMLQDQIVVERDINGGTDKWDPAFGPGAIALVRDPSGTGPDSFGSYLVYRKLEQNVRAFNEREEELAGALGLVGDDEERAGAMAVGRFEDGTPLVMQLHDHGSPAAANNFNYSSDLDGLKCPFHAHIRKVNPRGGTSDEFGVPVADERSHLMPRRGIPFGERHGQLDDIANMPTHGVGLLFMAYNQDIARQFEFTQRSWANEKDFLRPGTGIDPIIGQGGAGGQAWRPDYGQPGSTVPFDFDGFVTMRGGEYFFAPSIGFLHGLN